MLPLLNRDDVLQTPESTFLKLPTPTEQPVLKLSRLQKVNVQTTDRTLLCFLTFTVVHRRGTLIEGVTSRRSSVSLKNVPPSLTIFVLTRLFVTPLTLTEMTGTEFSVYHSKYGIRYRTFIRTNLSSHPVSRVDSHPFHTTLNPSTKFWWCVCFDISCYIFSRFIGTDF